MQTFLPYKSFEKSAKVLDSKRLGNQAYRECKTLINGGWKNHPIAKIWQNHRYALALYAIACLKELSKRGRHYQNHIDFFSDCTKKYPDTGNPKIIGNDQFHASHRSNLLRKDIKYYGKFGWKEPDNLPYVWFA